jgi:hypothetical protein
MTKLNKWPNRSRRGQPLITSLTGSVNSLYVSLWPFPESGNSLRSQSNVLYQKTYRNGKSKWYLYMFYKHIHIWYIWSLWKMIFVHTSCTHTHPQWVWDPSHMHESHIHCECVYNVCKWHNSEPMHVKWVSYAPNVNMYTNKKILIFLHHIILHQLYTETKSVNPIYVSPIYMDPTPNVSWCKVNIG